MYGELLMLKHQLPDLLSNSNKPTVTENQTKCVNLAAQLY